MARIVKTHCTSIEARPGLVEWCNATKVLYNKVVAFYFGLYQTYPSLLDLTQKEALTQAEKRTHHTKENPTPLCPLDKAISADIPAMVRRAAINAARGAFQAFHSSLKCWRTQKEKFEAKGKRFHKRPPIPPRLFNFNFPFYKWMYRERTDHIIMVRLYSGTSWQWVKLRLIGEQLPVGWK